MKYLILLLFLAGCATNPTEAYRQGCLDGMIHDRKMNGNPMGDFLQDPSNEAYVRKNLDRYVCTPLSRQWEDQKEHHDYPKGR